MNNEQRHVGFAGATGIGLGAIIGGGILAMGGLAFASAGPAAMLAFLLNGLICMLTAASYAEMSSAFPENGGAYAFTRKVLSVQAAFAVGWILWFASLAAGVLYALGFATFLLEMIAELWRVSANGSVPGWLLSRWLTLLLAASAILTYAWVLTRKTGGGGQYETIGKILVFGVIIIIGLFVFFFRRNPGESIKNLSPFLPFGWRGLATAMGFTVIALQGFDIIAAVAGEVKDPVRNLPRSMFSSLAIALVIYLPLLLLITTIGIPGPESLVTFAERNPETMIPRAIQNFLGAPGFWLIMLAAVLSMLSALYANMLAASRIAFAMGRDRTLPRWFSRRGGKTDDIPVNAVLATALLLLLLMFAVPDLAGAGAAASLIFLLSFALAHITCMLARMRIGRRRNAFSTPFFPLLPLTGFFCCAGLAVFQALAIPSAGITTGLWLAVGLALYFSMFAGRAKVVDAFSGATDPELLKLRGHSPLVLVPMSNPKNAKAMVQTANAMAPKAIGRVLLLNVANSAGSEPEQVAKQVESSQAVLREALTEALSAGIAPESIITVAPQVWDEIKRVTQTHHCESILLGLSDLTIAGNRHLEDILRKLTCDIVIMHIPEGWRLADARRILVPVRGHGDHDELRARLLGSLCRDNTRQVKFIQVAPLNTAPRKYERLLQELREAATEEAPGNGECSLLLSNAPVAEIIKAAAESDLVLLGMQKRRNDSAISETALAITKAAAGATILISRAGTG